MPGLMDLPDELLVLITEDITDGMWVQPKYPSPQLHFRFVNKTFYRIWCHVALTRLEIVKEVIRNSFYFKPLLKKKLILLKWDAFRAGRAQKITFLSVLEQLTNELTPLLSSLPEPFRPDNADQTCREALITAVHVYWKSKVIIRALSPNDRSHPASDKYYDKNHPLENASVILGPYAREDSIGEQLQESLWIPAAIGNGRLLEFLLEQTTKDPGRPRLALPLNIAIRAGHPHVVRILLESGADPSTKDHLGNTALHHAVNPSHHAVYRRDRDIIQMLLRSGMDIERLNGEQQTALGLAAHRYEDEVVRQLVEGGADIDNPFHSTRKGSARFGLPITLLGFASETNIPQSSDLVRFLLQRGAAVNLPPERSCYLASALILALHAGHGLVVKMLLEAGATLEEGELHRAVHVTVARSRSRLLPPDEAGSDGDHPVPPGADVRRPNDILILSRADRGFGLSCRQHPGIREYLKRVAREGDTALISLLMDKISNSKDAGCIYSATMPEAAQSGHGELLEMLLRRGADLWRKHHLDYLLRKAAGSGHDHVIELLLKRGAGVEAGFATGATSLHRAASGGYPSTVRLLLNHGANLNAVDANNNTPFLRALERGRTAVVCLLLYDYQPSIQNPTTAQLKILKLAKRHDTEGLLTAIQWAFPELESDSDT
ncbi:MAG: hypothetical protein M1823_005153 [Watsoniomyces obsoletus]|nr:MAG: hypothetical protein M1823_005153 [Watsoniomyces obsoletus]